MDLAIAASEFVPLFDGVKDEVNRVLQVRSYGHRGVFERRMPTQEDGALVVGAVFGALSRRFDRIPDSPKQSLQNWRLHAPQLNEWHGGDPEIDLERRLVKARKASDWWNQVPVGSGLVARSADHTRSIDLVHERRAGSYDFVELKIKSNTPVYAAVEILQYGFVWLLSRRHRDRLGYLSGIPTLLDGTDARLFVLAPKEFYRKLDLEAFQSGVDGALRDIAATLDARMSFRFLEFPDKFDPMYKAYDNHSLRAALDGLPLE